ncbi:MAG: glycosyltransferase family 39 protein, partial [Saprospiraceae bacterium]
MAAKSKTNQQPAKSTKAPVAKPRPAARPVIPVVPLTHTFQPGFWPANWLPVVALLGLAGILYALSVHFGYILDDEIVIAKNEYVQSGWSGIRKIFASDSFLGYFKEPKFLLEGGRYRPLSLATFAAEVGFFGKDNPNLPHYSHAINILLYGLTGGLLYRILTGLFPLPEGGRWYFSVAFLGSAIFLLHPLHVEVVANIKGRDEILALLGGLGALWAILKYYDTRNFGWPVLAGVLLFLGMLSKENAITFVAVIPLTVWVFAKVPARSLVAPTMALLASALLFILVRYQALGYMLNPGKVLVSDLMNDPFLGMTFGEKTATIFLTLGWYVKLLFIPHPLTHDYYPYHVPKVGWSDWRALVSLALYLGMAVWAVLNLKKRSVIAWGILYFLLTLSIVSNLFV